MSDEMIAPLDTHTHIRTHNTSFATQTDRQAIRSSFCSTHMSCLRVFFEDAKQILYIDCSDH